MEKIKKYVERFMQGTRMNDHYSMRAVEWFDLAMEARSGNADAISTTFNFGYAKGYRAAMAEMKKGGAV